MTTEYKISSLPAGEYNSMSEKEREAWKITDDFIINRYYKSLVYHAKEMEIGDYFSLPIKDSGGFTDCKFPMTKRMRDALIEAAKAEIEEIKKRFNSTIKTLSI